MPLRGKTVLENTIDSMLLSGVEQIVIVLGYRGQELEELLKKRYVGNRFVIVYNEHYAETDMLTSLKIGLASMPQCQAFFLLPGDMPMIDKETYLAIYKAVVDVDDLGCWTDLDTRDQYQNCLLKISNKNNATDKGGD